MAPGANLESPLSDGDSGMFCLLDGKKSFKAEKINIKIPKIHLKCSQLFFLCW